MNKPKMTDFNQWNNKIEPRSHWYTSTHKSWTNGLIYTEHGIVRVTLVSERSWQHTGLDFVWNGREYTRAWDRAWGRKTVTRLAKEFARDITKEVILST